MCFLSSDTVLIFFQTGLQLAGGHLSLYTLTIERGTQFFQRYHSTDPRQKSEFSVLCSQRPLTTRSRIAVSGRGSGSV